MNHDYEHCIDFKDDCPESCQRAQLVRDLEENYPEMRVSWMNFGDFPECERNRLAKNSPKAANNIDDQISRSEIVSALKERAETLKGIYGDIGGACSGAAKLAESMPPATYTKIKPPPDYARIIAHLPEEKDVPDTNVGDMISRQSVVYALERTKRIAKNNVNGAVLRTFEEVLDSLINITNLLPPVQHEITHEQAVDYLQSTGWMQEHDRQMMLDGVHRLTVQPEKRTDKRTETHACDSISRQAAIDAVQNRHMMLSKEKILLVNDLEKLPPAPTEQDWIPVNEEMPPLRHDVWLTVFFHEKWNVTEGYRQDGEFMFWNHGRLDSALDEENRVTAWKPKSKPYQPDAK